MMLIIKKNNGSIQATTIEDFTYRYDLQFSAAETHELANIEVPKIVALYQQLELEMKPWIIEKLSEDYKFKLSIEN